MNKETISTKKKKFSNVQTHQILVSEASLNINYSYPLFTNGETEPLRIYPRTYIWGSARGISSSPST